MILDYLEIVAATELMVLGTEGGQEHGLLERTEGLPEPQTSISFPEIQYPGLGRGGKEGLCAFVSILGDFGILMKTPLSHYSQVCITFE